MVLTRHHANTSTMRNTTLTDLGALLRGAVASTIVFTSIGVKAQTYYYIDQIMVSPASPTTADDISITVNGSLSSTAAYVVNTAFGINGNTIQLTVNAAVQGIGLDVLVPHAESIPIGNLAAGTYTITIAGIAVSDMAPSPEHQFVVSGGTPTDCDSLDILSVQWAAFTPERIIITAANGSSDLFDYPGFVLLNTDGDTIAKETVNYFGIGQGPQPHSLDVMPGVVIDGSTITGELHLWSDFYSQPECQWSGIWDLCPAAECTTVFPYFWNFGNAIVVVDVPYSIMNDDGQIITTGTFQLTTDSQSVYGTDVCLPPDGYTLHLDQVGQVGGQLVYGLSTSMTGNEQLQEPYVQGTATNELAFPLYEACIDGSNGIPQQTTGPGLGLGIDGDCLFVNALDGSSIGTFQLVDCGGRILRTGTLNANTGEVSLAGLASAVYVLNSERLGSVRFVR